MNYAKHIVNQFVLLHLRVLITLHLFWSCSDITIHHKREDATFLEHSLPWKFAPLGGKTRKNVGTQIDIINTLIISMVKVFSLLLLPLLWMIDIFHFQLYVLCSMAEIDRYLYFYQ